MIWLPLADLRIEASRLTRGKWLVRLQERIFVYAVDGELKTDHSFSLAGQRFLTLHYEIERLAVARA